MRKLKKLLPLACVLMLAAAGPGLWAEQARPNIIHIMADDLGWRDLSGYGSETFDTPHLDRLAEKGMIFSEAYAASPLCSPTRAATLTGQTVSRIRITSPTGHLPQVVLDPRVPATNSPGFPATNPGNRSRLPLDSVTISRVLKDAGYATAHLGKWHLGHPPFIPESFGYDLVIGGRGTPGPPQSRFFGPWDPEADNVPPVEGNPNIDDVLGDYAVTFIEENRDNPFFLAFWLYNPHAPFQGKRAVIDDYYEAASEAMYQQSAIMASMVKTIDDNVGKVIEVLEREGLWENTIVIFTSDNGGNMYDRPDGVNPTDNHPLRAGKGNNYEGGVRVPLIVAWPGVVEAGSYSDAVSISYDWFPTFRELAGLPAPEGWTLDGKSLMPALRGDPFERGPIFSSFPHTVLATGNYANAWVRDGNWKLMRFFNAGSGQEDLLELYDLSRDVGETHNRAHDYPEVAARLNDLLSRQFEDEEALLPLKNPLYDPDFQQAGFRMVHGAFFVGGPNHTQATFTAKSHRVTLRYDLGARGAPGDTLAFSGVSNSAVSVTAGAGQTPVFGPPVQIVPDLSSQEIRIPLDRRVESGELTVIFDLEQPGRTQITNPRMIDGDRDSFVPPRFVEGVPGFSFESTAANRLGDWVPANDIISVDLEDGFLVGRSAGSDPHFELGRVQFRAEAVNEIVVKMRSDKPGVAELFWATQGQPDFSQDRSVTAGLAGTGEWEVLRFSMVQHPQWRHRITRLRFDPINQPNTTFGIHSMEAAGNAK
jgi:arylsulfatase A-like enzyme